VLCSFTITVVTDANVLINLIHVGRLLLLGQVPGHRFVVPDAVAAEVTVDDQRAQLTAAVAANAVSLCSLTDLSGLALFANFRTIMGAGEAACLVLAELNGWHVASDERRRFRREVMVRLGPERLLTTPMIYVQAIRAGLITLAEADADKELLAGRKFVMRFGSFSDLLDPGPS
jgi:predicted nucleic acid-binding protein